MWLPALAAPALVFFVALTAVRRQRWRPLALAAPIALALTICFEAALLNVLSAFHLVARNPLLAAHGCVAPFAVAAAIRRFRAGGPRPALRPRGTALMPRALVLALAVPVAYSALLYVPNNWDSMTYHLARVAHWMQHRSVATFDTNVSRQVTYPPGAEYLLLVLQTIAGTDRLAGLVQLSSWLMVACAAEALGRIFGVPLWLAPWVGLLFAAAPMALLQASSTQNDLVASSVTMAVAATCLPFLHGRARWHASDLVLLSTALSAAVLVKPTALVVTFPFLLWSVIASARGWARARGPRPSLAQGLLAGGLVALALLGPEVARRAGAPENGEFAPFVYRSLSEWPDRTVNILRGVVRHFPLPDRWTAPLAGRRTIGCSIPDSMCSELAAQAHEDVAGNPASAAIVVILLVVGLLRRKSLPPRGRSVLLAIAGAWILFCSVFRDNVWIARLHLPLFALAPLAGAALRGVTAGRRRLLGSLVPPLGVALVALGAHAAFRNELRPVPNELDASRGALAANYYAAHPERWPAHVRAMSAILESGCKRLGLIIGGDSYDYPITWRAMQRGIAVRHVVRPDDWPCVVFSERGPPPRSPRGDWCPVPGDPEVFVRSSDAASSAACGERPRARAATP